MSSVARRSPIIDRTLGRFFFSDLPSKRDTTALRVAVGQAGSFSVRKRFHTSRKVGLSGKGPTCPRGMAIKFRLPDGSTTDLVAHSYNGFPTATAKEFLELANALVASGP